MDGQIDRAYKNYTNARKSWECWCFMISYNMKQPQTERIQYIDTHPLLYHLRYTVMKDFYIEMYKLLKKSRNNRDNLFNLLESYATRYPHKSRAINNNLLRLEKCKNAIDKLCIVRDKFYAHLDENYKDFVKVGIPLQEINSCFIAVERSLITLSSTKKMNSCLKEILSRDELSL